MPRIQGSLSKREENYFQNPLQKGLQIPFEQSIENKADFEYSFCLWIQNEFSFYVGRNSKNRRPDSGAFFFSDKTTILRYNKT